jgi:D-alanyl-D-alanine carboxypeptidase
MTSQPHFLTASARSDDHGAMLCRQSNNGREKKVLSMAKRKAPPGSKVCVLLLLLLITSSPIARAQVPKPADATKSAEPPKSFDLPAIDSYVADQVREQGYAGLSLAIVRDGKVVLAKGYGKRLVEQGTPVEPDTPFAIGSVTKQFICACVLLLAEDGKLAVEDKVVKYEPSLSRAGDISLHDLMTHISGYPDFYPLDFVDRRLVKPVRADALLAEYAGANLDFEPGSRWSYSNTGYMVLGSVVAKVSGKPLGQFIKERILDPLSMTHSAFEPGEDMKGKTRGYTSFALGPLEPAEPEASGWLHAAGGMWASAPDLARWDLALLEGRILKPESFRVMATPRTLKNGQTTGYGCGLNIRQMDGETVLAHGGAVSGFLSFNALIPRTRSAVIILTNTEHLPVDALYSKILRLLVDDYKKEGTPHVPKVHGPSPQEAALDFLHQMQEGKVDRNTLGEEFGVFLTDERLRKAAERLKALGEPEKVEVVSVSERGGMEVASIHFKFKSAELGGLLYRSPDGKIQQLLFRKQ